MPRPAADPRPEPSPPPVAPRRPHVIRHHDHERVDDWYWLRSDDRSDPEVLALLRAENDHTEAVTSHLAAAREQLFEEIRGRIKETDLSVPVRHHGWWHYQRTEEGRQYPVLCRTATEPPADMEALAGQAVAGEEVVLDLNVLAGDSDYFALGAYDVAPGQRRVAYSTDHDGSERYLLHIRDLDSGEDLPDRIPDTSYGTAWAGDDVLFYVRQDAAQRPYQLWRHVVGRAADDDVLVHQEDDERFFLSVGLSRTERFVHLSLGSKVTTEEWVIPADDPFAEPRLVQAREHGVEYDVTHAPSARHGDRFLVTTNAGGALNFKVVSAPVETPGREYWTEVVPHRPDVKIEGVTAFRHHVVRYERADAVRRIVVTEDATGEERVLELPEEVYATGPSANPEFDTTVLRFGYSSLVTPASVYEEDLATGRRHLLKRTEVLGGHDPDDYESGREWATAPDGTRVPISWVGRKGTPRDGSAPCLLYGYGSYEACIDPSFSSIRRSLLDRGVVFAIAHVRGGGELGRPWYEDGKLRAKTNTFTDFVACAEHLVAQGYTAPERLAARGGSAGGMLMGAVANLRPDLFRVIVAEVPFVDCLTTMLDESLPLTVTEWEEWGDPLHDPEAYQWMLAYSPYDNVTDQPYPAMLVTAGLNDPRVSYWEPAKWVQKLRAHSASGAPVVLKTEMGAGHQGPSGRYDAWRDEAFVLSFVMDQLGVPID